MNCRHQSKYHRRWRALYARRNQVFINLKAWVHIFWTKRNETKRFETKTYFAWNETKSIGQISNKIPMSSNHWARLSTKQMIGRNETKLEKLEALPPVENWGFLKASRQGIEVVNISGLEQRQSLRILQLALLESMLVVPTPPCVFVEHNFLWQLKWHLVTFNI